MGMLHRSRSFFMKQRCQWRMLFFWDVKSWPGGYLPLFLQKHVATFNSTSNHPCTHIWQEQVPLDTFRKSVKNCMLHIPGYSILHSYHPEDLKTRTNVSLSMYCVMGLKFVLDVMTRSYMQWISTELVSPSQRCLPCHSASSAFECLAEVAWLLSSIIPRSNTTLCFFSGV